MPFLIFFFFITLEFNQISGQLITFSFENNFLFLIVFLFVIVCGCVLCFSQIWCTTNNNAITTSVVGVLKSFIQTILGMFFYDAYKSMGVLAFVGILINLIFGTWYTYLKYIEKESRSYIHLSSSDPKLIDTNKTNNDV